MSIWLQNESWNHSRHTLVRYSEGTLHQQLWKDKGMLQTVLESQTLFLKMCHYLSGLFFSAQAVLTTVWFACRNTGTAFWFIINVEIYCVLFCFSFFYSMTLLWCLFITARRGQEGGNPSTVLSMPQRVCSPSRDCTGSSIVPGYKTECFL